MKKFNLIISLLIAAASYACNDDNGTYDYDYDASVVISIDTIGVDVSGLWQSWRVGDTVDMVPNVKTTGDSSNLAYRWFVMDFAYKPVESGNTTVYPKADTISYTQALNYVIDLVPGGHYQLWFMAVDTVTGVKAFEQYISYLPIAESDVSYGIYCAEMKDGHFEMDVLRSSRALILGEGRDTNVWSKNHPNDLWTSDIRMVNYSTAGGWFYVFMEDGTAKRVSPTGLAYMDESWNDMFYTAPTYNPQGFGVANGCEFLLNDGQMHVLYVSAAGDRMFPAAITGSHDLSPWFQSATMSSWGHVDGAIDAYQIVFDNETESFRPYYSKAVSLANFAEADGTALFDVNNMGGTILYSATVNDVETMSIVDRGGDYWCDVACFNNVIDDGKLSRYHQSLAGCPNIGNATCFVAGPAGPAFFYGYGNKVYSYSYTTGQTSANVLWESEIADEEITSLLLLSTGGFPTGGRILWIATWSESAQEGRVVEFEISPTTGLAEAIYAPMFSGIEENPVIYDGFGKISCMIEKTAYN